MNKLNSSIKERREVLLKSIRKKKEDETQHERPSEDDTGEPELKDQVHDSIHTLVRLGYDFNTILRGSGVNETFLKTIFQELGYCKSKPDLEIITSDNEENETSNTPENSKRSIQLEIQLFMIRVQLEINKISSTLDNINDDTQLRDTLLRNNLEKKKEDLFSSLNGLFDKLGRKEKDLETQQEKNHINSQDEIIGASNKRFELNQEENIPGILIDSGFVKLASSTAQGFEPYHPVISPNQK